MKIFGFSLTTIIFVILFIIVGKKFGGMIPIIKNI